MLIDCLASTGSDALAPILGGAVLLALGITLLLLARRRGRRSATAAALIALVIAAGLVSGLGGAAAPAHAAGGCSPDRAPSVVLPTSTPTTTLPTEPVPAASPAPTGAPTAPSTDAPTTEPTVQPTTPTSPQPPVATTPPAVPSTPPTAVPSTPPTTVPTTVPTAGPTAPLVGDFFNAAFRFSVADAPDTALLVTRRIWDDYNNCVVETRDKEDRRKWVADEFGQITGTLRWEKIGSVSCAVDLSRLHYSFAFYDSGVLVDEYLVNAAFVGNPLPFPLPDGIDQYLDGAASACFGPYNSSTTAGARHVSCTRRQETAEPLLFAFGPQGGPASPLAPAPGLPTDVPAPSPTP
ncbi:hypothetical protein SAMN06295885_0710 [Rathayibacter oskolensis]|uniref:LPXTG-motif cell wall anchor domain-containing protein n=1 Tax=Rathayibacter oskolensis TaxID=1891671 RepID=A0A1X7N4D3_9MICO|nr:hypothetical protein [Rathayibacter oskolensis]SMH32227.1 hypothetical protein SAMN06295885_0710 [Rathayibacter oskolensis]